MSGTSMDGIDAVLVSFENDVTQLCGTASIPVPEKIRSALTQLLRNDNISLKSLGETDTKMGNVFSDVVLDLLQKTNMRAKNIIAIGSHGQTIFHHPNSENPFTMQIGDPNVIAAKTKITTVADFRRRDMALGGQGAPLVPLFHDYLCRDRLQNCAVVNIGGIANITFLPKNAGEKIIGFDSGPGNTLLDRWHEKHFNTPVDFNGAWAKGGQCNHPLLTVLLQDEYFQKPFPKSTGREYFNVNWLDQKLKLFNQDISANDIQNTLTELTAKTIADAITSTPTPAIYLCGGGVLNHYLMERLHANLPSVQIETTEKLGIHPQWVEACAFAWLAKQTLKKKPGNCVSVTGAVEETILGGVYF